MRAADDVIRPGGLAGTLALARQLFFTGGQRAPTVYLLRPFVPNETEIFIHHRRYSSAQLPSAEKPIDIKTFFKHFYTFLV